MKLFNRWVLIFSIEILALALIMWAGLFTLILEGDPLKLGFIIPVVWFFYSLWIGKHIFQAKCVHEIKREAGSFMVDSLQALGLLGTVGGFIIGLSGLDVATLVGGGSLIESIAILLVGTAGALYATAAGIGCSMLINIQLLITGKVQD